MRKLVCLALFLFISCSKKELHNDFRKVMLEYQKQYPVKNNLKNRKYMYSVYFFKTNNDTLFTITRGANGIPNFVANDSHSFGTYSDSELKTL